MHCNWLYYRTIIFKQCYIGPFAGEFGHLLAHYVPFVSYFHSKGVKVHYCGMELHKPFYVDENGQPITASYLAVRDFFAESPPSSNVIKEPEDVRAITSAFVAKAKKSFYPYWDLSNFDFYFYFFRWWKLKKGYMKSYDIGKVYRTQKENSVVLFPRKWNPNFPERYAVQLKNNGEMWDYLELSRLLSRHFEKVYVMGHPVFTSFDFSSFGNVEAILTSDNRLIVEKCANTRLMITPHSGVNNLGVYTRTPVLMIYKGGREVGDIDVTNAFRKGLKEKYPLMFAFSMEEVEDFVTKHLSQIEK